jgi:hypothetical protein
LLIATQVSREHVVEVLRTAGMYDVADEAIGRCPTSLTWSAQQSFSPATA